MLEGVEICDSRVSINSPGNNSREYGISLNNKWSLDISQHLRLKENLAVIDNYITQTEVYFKPAKRWKIAGQMRYYYRNDNQGGIQGYENMLRYRLGVEKKFKLKQIQ